jgi:ABC-2 type transport system ATP-binding protein
MIMGLLTPTSGRVKVLGADMPHQRYRVLHRMNFESPYVEMPMRLTIRQNLTVFGMLYGVRNVAKRIEELGETLDLSQLLDRPTGKLSAGQKTRVSLASHNMSEVERLCQRVIIMKQGRIEDDDTPARLLSRYGRRTLEEVFLDVARGREDAREAAQ